MRKEPKKEYQFTNPAKAAEAGRRGGKSLLKKYGSDYFRQLVQKREDRKKLSTSGVTKTG